MNYESVIAILKKELEDKLKDLLDTESEIGILVAESEDLKMQLMQLESAIKKLGE